MTDRKISELDLVTGVSPADEMIINVGGGDNATTSRVSLETLLGGNAVSGIQYSSIFTSNMDVRKTEDFDTSFIDISSETDSSGVVVTKPMLEWVTDSIEVPVPPEADGAIIIGYTSTATIPTDNLATHPFYVSGSQTQANITTQLLHRFTITGATMEPDFNGQAGVMGWQDTHNTAFYMQDNTVRNDAVGRQKRENFLSVNQICKVGFCKFPAGTNKLNIDYALDVYRSEFTILDMRPIRLLVLPTQGLDSGTVASLITADWDSEAPPTPITRQDYNDQIASVQMKEIRHVMTMMDAYQLVEGPNGNDNMSQSDLDTFDGIRTTLLGLSGSTDSTAVGNAIKTAKGQASGIIGFNFDYNTSNPYGLFT